LDLRESAGWIEKIHRMFHNLDSTRSFFFSAPQGTHFRCYEPGFGALPLTVDARQDVFTFCFPYHSQCQSLNFPITARLSKNHYIILTEKEQYLSFIIFCLQRAHIFFCVK
jgi:hypothetical protein